MISVFAYGLYNLVSDVSFQLTRFTGLQLAQQMDGWHISLGRYPVGVRVLLDMLFLITLLYTVARQQAAERERRSALELEITSAQEIQRVLVPDTLPELSCFSIAAIYKPAEEVGGDFFQILPSPDGGVLVVIGDVSGKGLKAAMTVAMIVGTIRAMAETLESPAAILSGLNRRLIGRTAGGFATCLALHIDAVGEAILANAGHLAPFLNREELPMEGSVPLGIVEDVAYDEARFSFEDGDRLTLYTDGLLEARNGSGELYGFDRVRRLLSGMPSVDRIAEEAVHFGQQDDITLLALTRSANGRLDLRGTP